MGSSSSHLAADTRYTDPSWLDGRKGEVCDVRVYSVRIGQVLGLGVHHCIVVDGIDGNWRVFEWSSSGDNGGLSQYKTSKIYGQQCLSLGRHSLKKVYDAAQKISVGRCYSSNFNCNDWTEAVARELGHNITVHWNCSCVL